jgi:hypothetical protein
MTATVPKLHCIPYYNKIPLISERWHSSGTGITDHSHPPCAQVTNDWSCTSTLQYTFMACARTHVTLIGQLSDLTVIRFTLWPEPCLTETDQPENLLRQCKFAVERNLDGKLILFVNIKLELSQKHVIRIAVIGSCWRGDEEASW